MTKKWRIKWGLVTKLAHQLDWQVVIRKINQVNLMIPKGT